MLPETKLYLPRHGTLELGGTLGRQPESGQRVSKVTTKGTKSQKWYMREHIIDALPDYIIYNRL